MLDVHLGEYALDPKLMGYIGRFIYIYIYICTHLHIHIYGLYRKSFRAAGFGHWVSSCLIKGW